MVSQVGLSLGSRNPDVLSCIANLSNDEVFTPPEFANQMLDLLTEQWAVDNGGANIWSDPTVTFLDPFTKSGVFLREITTRLVRGLEPVIPDLEQRVDHVLSTQVFGIGITHLTALLARRSLYCSKWANGKHSVARSFDGPDGNIWFQPTQHSWVNGRCDYCGASQQEFDRQEGLDTHAYAFIHAEDIRVRLDELFGADMQFDVVIGNPPYQLNDGGHNNSATPIYQLFVENAFALEPRYVVMVTPSRWFAGGRGLDKFRERMLSDRRLRSIVDYPKLYDGFPGVKIRGGISYFLWDRDHHGPCSIQTMWDGEPVGDPVERFLDQFDVLIRWNQAVPIVEKVVAKGEPTLNARVSSQKPFGLRTFFHGKDSPAGLQDAVKIYGSQRESWIERSEVPQNPEWIDEWKVLVSRVQGTSAAVERIFLGKPIVSGPGEACTETYLVAGLFETEQEAQSYATYLRTRFVRFLVSQRKSTQDAAKGVYAFVPDLPLDQVWTDAKLYKRYGLTRDEIAFVESQVAPHDDGTSQGSDE